MPNELDRRMKMAMAAESASAARNRLYAAKAKKDGQGQLAKLHPERARGVKQAPFVVLQLVQMPASLVEIGFITNPSEERELRSGRGRQQVVAALVAAVQDYGRRHDARQGLRQPPAGSTE